MRRATRTSVTAPALGGALGAILGLVLGLAVTTSARADAWPKGVPKTPAAPVTDLAGMFSDQAAQYLDQGLRRQWQAGHFQLAVLTLPGLDDRPLEDVSIQIARAWGLGGKAQSNGVLLLIAAKERQVRIEVGSRLEGDLPDVVCRRIIADVMAPRMKQGDMDGALESGVGAITQILAPQDPLAAEADGNQAQGQGGAGGALAAGGLLALLLWFAGQPLFWVLLLAVIASVLNGLGGGGRGGFYGGGFGGGGFGGGGFGGGGFGGGGGGFSGGGASGGW